MSVPSRPDYRIEDCYVHDETGYVGCVTNTWVSESEDPDYDGSEKVAVDEMVTIIQELAVFHENPDDSKYSSFGEIADRAQTFINRLKGCE